MSDGPSAEQARRGGGRFPAARTAALSGWGRTAPSTAQVLTPQTTAQVAQALNRRTGRGVIARGLGRSYGDPAQNGGGLVVDMTALGRVLDVDLERGLVTAEAGTSIDRLIELFVPFGWFVPVTPGTRQVTLGGAIGADVHGKNHHAVGSFCNHVRSLDLLVADGTVRTVTPEGDPELFWATAGGMGLTGLVLSATVQMTRIDSSLVSVDTTRTRDLDQCMALMAEQDEQYTYTVAWLDCLAKGASMGRSVITSGNFAGLDQLSPRQRRDPLRFRSGTLVTAPDVFPSVMVNKLSMAAFNELWYRKAPKRKVGQLQSISAFFHPLDMVGEWNRVYGRTGFLQYQFVVPFEADAVIRRALEKISGHGAPSCLTVFKRCGPGNPGYLSFPKPGWTLALDFPTRTPGLARLLDDLDDLVLGNGGRLYLAKDSRMTPESLEAMYPDLRRFREVRAKVDPDGVFVSDQARRLAL